jgi:hypothetical protein
LANIRTYVKKLRYDAVTVPYLCLVHSVRINPSGDFFLMIGPRYPKANNGNADARA